MSEYEIIVTYRDGNTDKYSSKYIDIIKARYLLLKDEMNHNDNIVKITRLGLNKKRMKYERVLFFDTDSEI